jgi:hypothetical protein
MSRITGSEAKGLLEAYSAVYAPQELTEEQIWEKVENWVNSLLEEGYDLSDYTWEEMYEEYLNEYTRAADRPGKTAAEIKQDKQADIQRGRETGQRYQQATSSYKPPNIVRQLGSLFSGSASSGRLDSELGRDRRSKPPSTDRKSALDGRVSYTDPNKLSKDAAADLKNRYPQSPSRNSGGGAGGGIPPIAPAAQKIRPTSAAPRPGTKAAGPESIKPKTPNPLLAGGDIRRMQQASQMRQKGIDVTSNQLASAERTKPATPSQATAAAPSTSAAASGSVAPATAKLAATPKPTPLAPRQTAREKVLNQSYEYDAYDLVLEYLLDNGHAETVDEAHYVMLEMGAEVIQDIVEEQKATWNKGQKLTDPRAQKIYNKLTDTQSAGTKLPPA